MIPKAELHCHIEGAVDVPLAKSQASKYGIDISGILDSAGGYYWTDFTSFLAAYDLVASLIRTPQDYALLGESHYCNLANQGCIYGEIFVSPEHAERIGCSYGELIEAIADGMDAARLKTGIEGRMIVTGVRHMGVQSVEEAARSAAAQPHRLVSGFGLAGDERVGHPSDFSRAFAIARDAGLELTAHAGEFRGPQSVRDTLDCLQVRRIGHGVRSIEDRELVKRMASEGIVFEVCPASNLALGLYRDIHAHPLRALHEAGCIVAVNSDDPPHFHTSISNEYDLARQVFGDEAILRQLTVNAIKAAFVDGDTRTRLLEKCELSAIR
jgi:adenosine deaminase